MKLAIIADVHSNLHSLQAVLEDIASEEPDVILGAGDMVGCSAYPGALEVWNTLHELKIPFVLGNEEGRILNFYDPAGDAVLKNSVQYMPLQYRARQFPANEIEKMKALPLKIRLDGPQGQDVLVCHASPENLHKSPMQGIDATMEQALRAAQARVIALGHLHTPWHLYWEGKLLIMAGSAGLPLRGKLDEVDYLLLTYRQREWQFAYKVVQYDYQAATRDVIASDMLEQCGPIGWLMLAEILTQEDHLLPFLNEYCPAERPEELQSWQKLATGYLEQVKHWEMVKRYLQRLS